MKKVFIVLGLLAGLAALPFIINIAYAMGLYFFSDLDQESKTWVDTTALEILASWDSNEILKNASSEWLESVSIEETKTFSDQISQTFGTLVKYGVSTGEASLNVHNFTTTITAEYTIDVEFTKGPARVFIRGIKNDGVWKIYSLHIDTNPHLRWFNGQLTDQQIPEEAGDSKTINGVHYKKLLGW